MYKVCIYILLAALALPVFAQEFNAGFVQGLWYGNKDVFAERPVRIYVAIRNNTGSDLTGTVEFFDNGKRIERVTVSALNNRIIESWADWKPSYGEHTITATLSRTEISSSAEGAQAISVAEASATDTLFIDYDTDADGIGDTEDIDDDADGISDAVEEKNGTNPLVFDEPKKQDFTETVPTTAEVSTTSSTFAGIEQFLTPSRADTMLSNVTQFTQQVKSDLDAYRTRREIAHANEPEELPQIAVNESGFGEITRSTDTQKNESPISTTKKPTGIIGDIITLIVNIINGIYTGVLSLLSIILSHPIFVQLLILLGILLTLYKTAKKLGGRPTS